MSEFVKKGKRSRNWVGIWLKAIGSPFRTGNNATWKKEEDKVEIRNLNFFFFWWNSSYGGGGHCCCKGEDDDILPILLAAIAAAALFLQMVITMALAARKKRKRKKRSSPVNSNFPEAINEDHLYEDEDDLIDSSPLSRLYDLILAGTNTLQ